MPDAVSLIEKLGLVPHPEGGWFRETWRADHREGERASASAIYFLLESSQKSHWHKVDAAEIWLWHSGNAALLSSSDPLDPEVEQVTLGPDVLSGHVAQHIIAAGDWQAAEVLPGMHDYALVSCIVSPGFDFEGFTLAPPEWQPEG